MTDKELFQMALDSLVYIRDYGVDSQLAEQLLEKIKKCQAISDESYV